MGGIRRAGDLPRFPSSSIPFSPLPSPVLPLEVRTFWGLGKSKRQALLLIQRFYPLCDYLYPLSLHQNMNHLFIFVWIIYGYSMDTDILISKFQIRLLIHQTDLHPFKIYQNMNQKGVNLYCVV